MTTRDVGIRVAVTSDTKGAEQLLAAFERIAPAIEAALAKTGKAGDVAADGLKKVQKEADPAAKRLKEMERAVGDLASKVPGLASISGHLSGISPAALGAGVAVAGIGAAFVAVKAAAAGLEALVGGTLQAIGLASDLAEAQNKANVVFGAAVGPIEELARTAPAALGQTREQVLGLAGTFGNLLTSMGLSQGASAGMSADLVRLASDLASFNNIDPTQALDKLRAGLSGETEPLKSLGINLNDASLKAKAFELGLIGSVKDGLSPAAKAQASYALILEQSTNAQGDFARTATGLANSSRIVKASFHEIKTSAGEAFRPLAETVMGALGGLMPRVQQAIGPLSESIKGFLSNPAFAAAIQNLGRLIGDVLVGGLTWLKSAFDSLVQSGAMTVLQNALMGLGAGLMLLWDIMQPVATFIQNNLTIVLTTLAGLGIGAVIAAAVLAAPVIVALATAVWGLIAPILAAAAPFILIGAAVGLLAGLMVKYWDEIKAAVGDGVTYASGALGSLLTTVASWAASVGTAVEGLVTAVTTKAVALWDQLVGLWQGGVDSVLGFAQSLWDGLLTSWESIRAGVSGAAQGLLTWLGEAWSGGVAFLQGLVLGLAENFRAAWQWIVTTVSTLAARLINWLQSSWGRAGTWLGGLLTRLANMFSQAWTWIRNTVGGVVTKLVNAALSAFRWLGQKAAGVWSRMQELFQSAWTGIVGIFRSAAGGIIRGLGNMFSKMAELAGKGLKAVGSAVYRIFTAILDKIKALLAGLGLGDIFASLMPDADGGGSGWLDGIASNVMNAARSVMDGIGDVMSFFETKWDNAKAKLEGFFDQSEQLQDQAEGQAAFGGFGAGFTPENVPGLPGAGGGGAAAGPKSHTAPDGMSGRGAEARAAAKGQKKPKGSTAGGGEDDPAVSAAKVAADTAKRITEALQSAADTLRELGRTELPGESVWGPKIAAIEAFIQAGLTSFDRLAVGLLDKIGQTEDGADLLETAKAKAIQAVAGLTGGMLESMTKVQTFLAGLVKAKWPDQSQIDVAFGHIGAALVRVRDQAIALAEGIGVGSGKEDETSPAAHLTAVGQALAGWVESFVKTAGLVDVLAKVKAAPAEALTIVETTLRRVGEISASFLKGPGYDLTADAEKTAADLEVSRDVQATLSAGVDLLSKVSAAAEQLARVKPVPDAAWQNVRAIMLGAATALFALVAGPGYDNTRDPERTAIIQTVGRDVQTTLSGGIDLLVKVSAAGRQLARTPAIPDAAWQNVQAIMGQVARALYELGAPLLRDTERSTKELAVSQALVGVMGSGITLVSQVVTLAGQMQKAAVIPDGALDRVKTTLLTVSQMLGALLVDPDGRYNLLKDAERTAVDLGLAGTMLQSLSQTLGVIAQATSLGDMLSKGRPFDPAAARVALTNAREALLMVQEYAATYAAELKAAEEFAEDRLSEVQQYGAALREAIGIMEAAGKLRLGTVLPIDPANVNQAIQNADLAFERLFAWATFMAARMENQGRDVLEVMEQAKLYGAALRDALGVLDTASKLKLADVLPWTPQDVTTAIANADLAFQRLFAWATFMEARLENQGRDILQTIEQTKVYGAALRDALGTLEAAGKFSLGSILPVDPVDVTTAIQNADLVLRLVADWAATWHKALADSRRDVETVSSEMATYGAAIKAALDLATAAAGAAFTEVLPINEAAVRQAMVNADFVLGAVEEFAAAWRRRVDVLQASLDKDRMTAEAAEIDHYTRSAGAALDLIGRAVELVVDTVPPVDRGMVQAALEKVRLVLDEVSAAAASWVLAIQAGGRRLADVASEAEAFSKAAGGAFDLLIKVRDFVEKVTAPTVLAPLERGEKRIPAPAIEATVTRLRDTMRLVMDQLVGLYDDIAGSSALPKVEQLTGIVAPAVDALTKVLDLLSLDRLMKSPLVDLKLRGAFASKAAQTRLEQMKRQIVEGIQRTVAALVDALQGIKVPADIGGSGIERLAAVYEHIASILERVASLQMPDASKLDAFIAAGQKLVAGAPTGPGGGGVAGALATAQVAASGSLATLKPPENKITINNTYNQYGDNSFFDEKATKLMLDRLGSFGVRTR